MRIPFASLLLLPLCTALNTAPLTVQSAIHMSAAEGVVPAHLVYTVPVVRASDPAIAARINALIGNADEGGEIETKPVASDGQLYLADAAVARIKQTTESLDYAIERNDDRVLTISIDGEYCSAYCEQSTEYLSFDARTGERLTLANLFAPNAVATLGKRIAASRLARIDRQIAQLKSGKINGRPPEDVETAVDMYDRCRQSHGAPDADSSSYLAYDGLNIGAHTLTFVHDRCSPHVIRALDDIGEFMTVFAFNELKPYLSDYGKTLLLLPDSTSGPVGPFSKILHGHIGGRLAITMNLELGGSDFVTGTYFYDKYRIPIRVNGQRHGATLALTEIESDDTPRPTMKLGIDGSKLKGTWKGKSSFAFEAAP